MSIKTPLKLHRQDFHRLIIIYNRAIRDIGRFYNNLLIKGSVETIIIGDNMLKFLIFHVI